MSFTNDKNTSESINCCTKPPVSKHFNNTLLVIMVLSVSTFLSGCAPAAFAVAAIALNELQRLERQKQQVSARNHYSTSSPSRPYSPPAAPPKVEETPESVVSEAVSAYQTLEWDRSSRLLHEVLKKETLSEPSRSEALIVLGGMEYQKGNIGNAREYFAQAKRHNPTIIPSSELFPPAVIEFYNSSNRR